MKDVTKEQWKEKRKTGAKGCADAESVRQCDLSSGKSEGDAQFVPKVGPKDDEEEKTVNTAYIRDFSEQFFGAQDKEEDDEETPLLPYQLDS